MSEANIAQTHGAVVASYGFTQIVDIEANKALVRLLTYPRKDKMREENIDYFETCTSAVGISYTGACIVGQLIYLWISYE